MVCGARKPPPKNLPCFYIIMWEDGSDIDVYALSCVGGMLPLNFLTSVRLNCLKCNVCMKLENVEELWSWFQLLKNSDINVVFQMRF